MPLAELELVLGVKWRIKAIKLNNSGLIYF
jgi:hypothetical protein